MKYLLLAALTVSLAGAEARYPKHNFTLGMGAGQPRGDLRPFFEDSFGIQFGYGYRFHEYFQGDIGFETLFGAAGVRDFYRTQLGELRIKDYQYLVPLGGRVVAPLARGRFQFSAGGGGAYMRYQERIRQPYTYYRIDCPVCGARSGWGYYGLLGASVALDRYQRFRMGVNSRVYRGHTDGDPLGEVRGIRTRDHWVNLYGEFGVSF